MTYREKYNSSEAWFDKCKVIYIFHTNKKKLYRRWPLADTAKYFELSVASISDAINLVEKRKHFNPDLVSKRQALKLIRFL